MVEKVNFHILNAAAQMTGVSVMVLTLFYSLHVSRDSLADEALTLGVFLFTLAVVFSYISLRKQGRERIERLADYLFLGGLLCLLITSGFLTFVLF